jgi:acyl-CoA thioesterase-1
MPPNSSIENRLHNCLGRALAALLAFGILGFIGAARAETIRIVALGASNTAGKGVESLSAWPAQLQSMLRAKGYDAQVTNAGISGDDTGRMLARLDSAVPDGTQIVILEKAATNDRQRGINTGANIAQMTSRLEARKIKVILIDGMHGWANQQLQADRVHITEAGHAAVAAKLLPRVVAAISKL